MTQSAEDGDFTSDDHAHGQPQPRKPRGRWHLWILVAVVGTLGPIATELPWRVIVFSESERARRDAERDWRQSRAFYARFDFDDPSVERFHDGFMFEYHYHPMTRLEVGNVIANGQRTYWHKYNMEVERLIERDGIPPWATKCDLPTAEDLTALMTDGALQELKTSEIQHAPALLTHGLMIQFDPGNARNSPALRITTPSGTVNYSDGNYRICVGRPAHFDDIVALRFGDSRYGNMRVYSAAGEHLCDVRSVSY